MGWGHNPDPYNFSKSIWKCHSLIVNAVALKHDRFGYSTLKGHVVGGSDDSGQV